MRKKTLAIAALTAAVAVGLAGFGVDREMKVRELSEQIENTANELNTAREELQSASDRLDTAAEELDALRGELETVTGERDGLLDRLAETQAELETANVKIDELSQPAGFDPDGPAYQQLYPDFYAPQPLDASNAPDNVIYLTFDDGPSARTDEILKTLEAENIKATFFIVGRAGEANRGRLQAIAAAGHTLAMHSYSHEYKTIYTSVEAFLDDMYKVFTLIRDETGVAPTYFRFPGGSTNTYAYGIIQEIISEMLRRGFVPCDWNMSAQDATKTPLPVEDIITNVLRSGNVARGVVLMHDSSARTTTAQALPGLIAALRERGCTFAPLTPDVKPVVFNYRAPKLDE